MGRGRHPLIFGWTEAERAAKKLMGPQGAVRFLKSAPKAERYAVGQVFEQAEPGGKTRVLFGVVGTGGSWETALREAERRIKKAAEEAEERGPEGEG